MRFTASGWHTEIVEDGNDLEAIDHALRSARQEKNRPSLIIVNTHLGFGSPNKQDTFAAHGAPLGEEEVKLTRRNLGWPEAPVFHVPEDVLHHFRKALDQGRLEEDKWNSLWSAYDKQYPDLAKELQQLILEELVPGWERDIPRFPADPKGMATRIASGNVMNAISTKLPGLIGGSADLNPSTFTELNKAGNFGSPAMANGDLQGSAEGGWSYAGRNIFFGIREHAMGAILNGMAAHGGLLPYGATFFSFSDYMRPPIRLAAIMNIHVIYIFTHDSIGVGEDGPTHQPVEHLDCLRAIPRLTVIRPGDANETAEAWRLAIKSTGPVALILTRQNVGTLDRDQYAFAEGVSKGAYILYDSPGRMPQIILIASGSETGLIVAAGKKLEEQKIAVRLVSMPSWELFEAQPEIYKESVFPRAVRKRLAVEAGVTRGWSRYVTDEGDVIGMDHFGVSAPGPVLMREFGFTVENICKRALALLKPAVLKPFGDGVRPIVACLPMNDPQDHHSTKYMSISPLFFAMILPRYSKTNSGSSLMYS